MFIDNRRCRFFSITVLTVLIVHKVLGECITPSGRIGECVNIRHCPRLYKLLHRKQSSPMNERNISPYLCGIDGVNYKVCCVEEEDVHPTKNIIYSQTPESLQFDETPIDSCTSLSNRKGSCLHIKKCPKMMNILMKKPLTEDNRSYLQRSHCGFEGIYPKVCCDIEDAVTSEENSVSRTPKFPGVGKTLTKENCVSVSGRRRHCVNIKKCQRMLNLLQQKPLTQETLDYLRRSQCGSGDFPKVCCEVEEEGTAVAFSSSPVEYCVIPGGEIGKCVNIHRCEDMKKLHKMDLWPSMYAKLLKSVSCGLEDPRDSDVRVCCRMSRSGVSGKIRESVIQRIPGKSRKTKLHPQDLCGPVPEGKIFGGNSTRIHEFPWMALLGYNMGGKRIAYRGSGTLISEKYVLTAAHCVTDLSSGVKLTKVRLGEYDMSTEEDCDDEDQCVPKYQEFLVADMKAHENYSKKSFQNDIGLVKLKSSVDIRSGNIRPICLPLDPQTFLGVLETPSRAVATGWGATEYGISSNRLQKVTLPIVTNELCQQVYKQINNMDISPKQLCVGGVRGKDSCSGDSGGPLQAIGTFGNRPGFIQYGIVSYGYTNCGTDGLPSVYTRVSQYVEWILDNMIESAIQ